MLNRYAPLKKFVAKRGGVRLAVRPKIRDELVEFCVDNWPDDNSEKTMRVKAGNFLRQKYGSILASILIALLVRVIVTLIIEWWTSREENRAAWRVWRTYAEVARAEEA